jgi:hypothetical protein
MVFETSVSTKAEPHYPAENPKELHCNSLVRRENIKMCIHNSSYFVLVYTRHTHILGDMLIFSKKREPFYDIIL